MTQLLENANTKMKSSLQTKTVNKSNHLPIVANIGMFNVGGSKPYNGSVSGKPVAQLPERKFIGD